MSGVTFLKYEDIDATRELILSGKIAAVFVEPIQDEGGIYSATKDFLQSLRTACDDVGSLLVFDEVQCGLGQTGYLWAHEAYGIYLDIMTLVKPLAGGLPIGATLVTERVNAAIKNDDHGSTFAGRPLVCAAAIAVFDKISKPSFYGQCFQERQVLNREVEEKLRRKPSCEGSTRVRANSWNLVGCFCLTTCGCVSGVWSSGIDCRQRRCC